MHYLNHLFSIVQKCKGSWSSTMQVESNESVELGLFEEYKNVRRISRDFLYEKVIKTLHNTILLECGKKLGLYYNKALCFSREGEASVLFDYATYHHRIMGKNVVERYALRHGKILTEQEEKILIYHTSARFSLLKIEKCLKNGRVIVVDVLRNKELLLIDEGLSKTAVQDLLLLSNVISCGTFDMTTGAAIPLATQNIVDNVMELFLQLPNKYSTIDSFNVASAKATVSGDILYYFSLFESRYPFWKRR